MLLVEVLDSVETAVLPYVNGCADSIAGRCVVTVYPTRVAAVLLAVMFLQPLFHLQRLF